jgi:hypothetical protein
MRDTSLSQEVWCRDGGEGLPLRGVCLGRGGVSDSDDGGWSLRGSGSYYSLDLWVRPLYSILLIGIYKLVGL